MKSSSEDFEIEQKHLDDRILKINEQQSKEIHQFRNKLYALFEPAALHNPKRKEGKVSTEDHFPAVTIPSVATTAVRGTSLINCFKQ